MIAFIVLSTFLVWLLWAMFKDEVPQQDYINEGWNEQGYIP